MEKTLAAPPSTSRRQTGRNYLAREDRRTIWDELGVEQGYTGFSCPLEPFDESLAQLIAGEYARSVLGVFIERFDHVLSKNGLHDLFSSLLTADLPLALAWSLELGNLYNATQSGDEDRALKNAAAFALMINADGERPLVLVPRGAAVESGVFYDAGDASDALETFPPALIAAWTATFALLEQHVPHYFAWVVRIIRRVAITHSEQGLLRSGSHPNRHGTIHISDNLRVLSLAEMLIHEASHQYLELLTKLGPTVDPHHIELYYSPVKQCNRPLHKILLAYHAFANVMLFYRAVAECGLADAQLAKFQNALEDELRQLEEPLIDNDAILPVGGALVDPLIERSVWQ